MYLEYFGLSEFPFKSTPNTKMFFGEASRQATFEALLFTISRGDGIVKVTGEVGCGKTMILRMVADHVGSHFKTVYLNSPNLSPKDILLFIADELALDLDYALPKVRLIKAIKEKLIESFAKDKKVVLLIDEAQTIPLDTLEELRLLSNLETDEDKLLQIVLFGQPELDKALQHSQIRQLASRITYSIDLPRFNDKEVLSYLNYRLRAVGYRGLDIFDYKVAKVIHRLTGGIPRAINEVADKVLMAMYGEHAQKAKIKHLKSITSSGQFRFLNNKYIVFVPIIFIVVLVSAYYLQSMKSLLSVQEIQTVHSQFKSIASSNVSDSKEVFDETHEIVESKPELGNNTDVELSQFKTEEFSSTDTSQKLNAVVVDNTENEFLDNLLDKHQSSVELFTSISNKNVIQLATVPLKIAKKQIEILDNDKTTQNRYLVLLEKKGSSVNVKFFLNAFGKLEVLRKEVDKLSVNIRRSNPYILSSKGLLSDKHDFQLSDLQEIRN